MVKGKIYNDIHGYGRISYEPPHGFIAWIYRKLKSFEIHRHKVIYNLLPREGVRFLDIGCGDGEFIFISKNKFKECYGVDILQLRIEKAINRFKPVEAPDGEKEYAVGGEIIPVNPTPYLLSPALLAAIAIVAVILAASLTVKGFPIRIEITRQ